MPAAEEEGHEREGAQSPPARLAAIMIARNPLPSEAQGDFPSRRWDQLRRDVADFLTSPWPIIGYSVPP